MILNLTNQKAGVIFIQIKMAEMQQTPNAESQIGGKYIIDLTDFSRCMKNTTGLFLNICKIDRLYRKKVLACYVTVH